MCLTDTAEYWRDVKIPSNKRVFVHLSEHDCEHYHVYSTNKPSMITCYSCIEYLEQNKTLFNELSKKEKKAEKNRERKRRKKKGFKYESVIHFGKYNGRTIDWVIKNDKSYWEWLSDKILLHPEVQPSHIGGHG